MAKRATVPQAFRVLRFSNSQINGKGWQGLDRILAEVPVPPANGEA
jgi:hypothetical protein